MLSTGDAGVGVSGRSVGTWRYRRQSDQEQRGSQSTAGVLKTHRQTLGHLTSNNCSFHTKHPTHQATCNRINVCTYRRKATVWRLAAVRNED